MGNMGSVQSSSCETSSVQSDSCQGSFSSSVPKRGEYDVDPFLEELGEVGVVITVLEIGHYREPIQSSKRGLMHDFVGLRVRVGVRERLIKADKFKERLIEEEKFKERLIEEEKFKEKIKISKVESWETDRTEIKHGPVGVGDCGKMAMGDLLAILKEHSPVYSLYRDNCWLYADSTFRRLIRKFSAHPTISPERRSELEGFLNHPAPTMPFYVLLHSFLVFLGGAVAEAALALVASIGAAVLVASTVAVNLFPPEQLAQVLVTLRSPTVQNIVRHSSATVARGVLRTLPTLATAPPAVYQFLPAGAATGCPFCWPFAIAIGGSVVVFVLYRFGRLALEAFPRGQQRLSRRRTGPSMTLL